MRKILFCIWSKWTICTLCWGGGQLSSDPAAEQLLLIYDLNAKAWWRGYCLKAVRNAKWSGWRENPGNKKKHRCIVGAWEKAGGSQPLHDHKAYVSSPPTLMDFSLELEHVMLCAHWLEGSNWTFSEFLPVGMRTILHILATKIPCAVLAQSHCLRAATEFLPFPSTGASPQAGGFALACAWTASS